jgi:hypothetical protein
MLAGLLGWPQATFAAKVDVDKAAKKLTVERETDTGTQKLALVSTSSLPSAVHRACLCTLACLCCEKEGTVACCILQCAYSLKRCCSSLLCLVDVLQPIGLAVVEQPYC